MKIILQALLEILAGFLIWRSGPIAREAAEELWPLKQESNTSTKEKAQEQKPRPARLYWGFALFVVLMLGGIYLYIRSLWSLK